ncbi:MAG: metallophosphoesterase [Planctomycetes bacterium]|nr:metallophosphoesterase [Planctomycetota bacterium]
MVRRACSVTIVLLSVSFSSSGYCAENAPDQSTALTFFGWSDQHIQADGDGQHLIPAIEAMNALPGRPYPEAIGGTVEKPAFVFNMGDISEWPSRAALDTYEQLITKRLKFSSYDIAGNHDLGGLSPSDTVLNWLRQRHGALRYTFEKGGVCFIALFSEYDEKLNDPAQPITKEALDYLRQALAKIAEGKPVVVATHLCFEAITNRDQFVDAFGEAHVILVLGGHYHKATVNYYRGIPFVQLPSPAPKSAGEFTVFRITSDRVIASPFNYRANKWMTDKRKILDAAIKGPAKAEAPKEQVHP